MCVCLYMRMGCAGERVPDDDNNGGWFTADMELDLVGSSSIVLISVVVFGCCGGATASA